MKMKKLKLIQEEVSRAKKGILVGALVGLIYSLVDVGFTLEIISLPSWIPYWTVLPLVSIMLLSYGWWFGLMEAGVDSLIAILSIIPMWVIVGAIVGYFVSVVRRSLKGEK